MSDSQEKPYGASKGSSFQTFVVVALSILVLFVIVQICLNVSKEAIRNTQKEVSLTSTPQYV